MTRLAHRFQHGLRRVRASARPLLQAALAGPIAWILAHEVLGHATPLFAPISALVAIGATIAQPWRRAAEIVIGVAIGVALADGLTLLIGQGWWQIGVIVLLVMATAIMVGGGAMFVQQAGVAAALIASIPSQDGVASFDRFLDTLCGGVAALVITVLVLPVRPLELARRAARPVIDELGATFELIGKGLRRADPQVAEEALDQARATGDHWARLEEAVGIGRQAARIVPTRRHEEAVLVDLAQTVTQLDYAIRDARIMARVALRLTETGYPAGLRLDLSAREFARAVYALEGHLDGEYDATLASRAAAARATRVAIAAPVHDEDLLMGHLVGQIRSTTVDLLRATGLSRDEALTVMLAAVAEGRSDSDD
ncbi:MAG: FUSC family protein [Thermoleophilia bacterium]|nr:FUSC family protein [Thermoleophilia bacterium]